MTIIINGEVQGGAGASGVTSFNGRTGVVVPAANDYAHSQLTGIGSYTHASLDTLVVQQTEYNFVTDQLQIPNNADWAVNALAAPDVDSNNNGIPVRKFDDSTEQGIAIEGRIPTGVTNLVLFFKSRAEVAAGSNLVVVPKAYVREMGDNVAVEAWSAGTDLTSLTMGTSNEYWQYDTQTIALSTLGLTAGNLFQMEITRNTGSGSDTLVDDWTVAQITARFT
jgi:hypothetical protein